MHMFFHTKTIRIYCIFWRSDENGGLQNEQLIVTLETFIVVLAWNYVGVKINHDKQETENNRLDKKN